MQSTATAFTPKICYNKRMGIKELEERVGQLTDKRRTSHGNIRHKLVDIVMAGFMAVLCGGETFEDMETFTHMRLEWLREKANLGFANGVPDSDTFRRVFEFLDPKELANCLWGWLDFEREARSVVGIDGKTARGSANSKHSAFHIVTAFIAESQITLGEVVTDEKSNEITAVPELLKIIDVKGDIVTADAMSCQKEIVETIVKKGADYTIALKGNQPMLEAETREWFETFRESLPVLRTDDIGHGRIEHREYRLLTDISWLDKRGEWASLRGIGMARSRVIEKKTGRETVCERYFITSLASLEEFAYSARKHWSIENQLHWRLDVIFREDASKAKKDNSPLNLNVLRKVSLSLLNQFKAGQPKKRLSMNRLRYMCALSCDQLLSVLFPELK